MSYSRNPKLEKFDPLEEHLLTLQALQPGERMVIHCEDEFAADKVRMLLYEWLHMSSLKGRFKVVRLTSKELMVQRKENLEALIRSVFKLDKETNVLIESLIEVWGTVRADTLLEEWKTTGKLTEAEATALWDKVTKIMS